MRHLVLLVTLLFTLGMASAAWSEDLIMDKDALSSMLSEPDLVVLDVRTGKDWSSSEFKIKNAMRAPVGEYKDWSASLPKDKTLVTYCA
ncbi:MAG: rhodanese-like domain-containing protein [Desulfofustis sp.]|nr:rhodanese-like domain-containing protein [Desulfofustis sp.]NNF46421.1 rhodanese-like domain-containing protein [Desulfofustis sp.]NNK58121.1 rhodanese-like domain-containing protein [Desulfofustis sp.]